METKTATLRRKRLSELTLKETFCALFALIVIGFIAPPIIYGVGFAVLAIMDALR